LLERAEKLARHIVTLPPVAVRMMKEFVVRFGDLPTDQAWHVQTLINNMLIQVTTDGEEGRHAFNEKRPPNFSGALRRRGEAWEEPSEEDARRLDEAYRSGEF
jgi:1,4-dihydroxy-2-naphthoyl-CoA synthase